MKNIYKLLPVLLFSTQAFTQSLVLQNPLIIERPDSDKVVTVPFYIYNPHNEKFDIDISNLYNGNAVRDKDYAFTTVHISSDTDYADFPIVIKSGVTLSKKTINLYVKATSKDTTISSVLEIIVHNKGERVRLPDPTNTPKFEFVNYTDFKGFEPDQPNGLVQSQFLFKLPLNPYYIFLGKDSTTKIQLFRSLILPDFLFNRIDKDSMELALQPAYTFSTGDTTVNQIVNSFDFIKYANFILNGKLALVNLMRPQSRLQLQLNYSLYKVRVDPAPDSASSIASNAQTAESLNPVWATGYGLELFYETYYREEQFPFNFRFILGEQTIRVRSNEYRQADMPSVTPDHTPDTVFLINSYRKHSAPIWNVSLMLKKNLGLKKNTSSDHFLFFRFNYSWQFFKSDIATSAPAFKTAPVKSTNNYSQFQLGIDLNFDDFFN